MKALTSPYLSPSRASTSKCCQTGHPVLADPVTGRNTCSCQLQTGVPAYLSRVPSLPETMYAGHGATQLSMLHRHLMSNSLYASRTDDRSNTALKAAPPSGHLPYHYEHMMAAHPYTAMYNPGFDINGMKRKNATRESTSALKAWLFQHRKNPYPTKAEKVMLAIVSQMTLTQVSTWFANARRRLKKESKMDDTDFDIDDIDDDQKSTSRLSDYDSDVTNNAADSSKLSSDASDFSDAEEQTTKSGIPTNHCMNRLFSPDSRNELFLERMSSPGDTVNKYTKPSGQKHLSGQVDATEISNTSGERKSETKSDTSPVKSGSSNTSDNVNNQVFPNRPTNKIWSIANIIG